MIFDPDNWREIWHTLAASKLRTALTAFGVFWGVFMLVVMVGAGRGLESGVWREFTATATNSFFVWTERTSKPYKGLPPNRVLHLNNADTEAIRVLVPEAATVCPRNQLGGFRGGNNVTRGTRAGAFQIMGDHPDIRLVDQILIERGRFIDLLDFDERRKVAVVGSRVVRLLFADGEDPIGQYIRINGVWFLVIGILAPSTSGEEAEEQAQTIFVPFSTFQHVFNYGDRVGWYAIRSRDDVPASVAEEKVLALLRDRHDVAPDDERAFGHFNIEEEFTQIRGLFAGISALIWIVGTGTLAAGVIGASNIMLVIVRERTNEIGIRRAIGASPRTVMTQVILEAVVLTSIAGYVGLIAGMAVMDWTKSFVDSFEQVQFFDDPRVDVDTALRAIVILVIAGVFAGIIPARRAVSVSPVEALRTEP